MENEDLRKREDNLKKINVSLVEALGSKEDRGDDIRNLIKQIF